MKNFSTKKIIKARKASIAFMGLAKTDGRYLRSFNEAVEEYHEQEDKLIKLIEQAQARAKVRKIEPIMIVLAIEEVEKKLSCVKRKNLAGCKITVDCNGQDFTNAYKGVPESTIFEAVYKNGAWVITDIYRSRTHPRSARHVVDLPHEAAEDILKSHTKF